jgi:zinc/manganese transport system ATP-binding protein
VRDTPVEVSPVGVAAAATAAGAAPEVLSLLDVTVRLGGRSILDRVGFTVRAGEFTGVIGSNGAGKTTMLRVILGLQPTSGGSVRVEGRPLGRRHRPVGYVPQKLVVDPDAPIRSRDLVALGLDGERLGLRLPSRRRTDLVEKTLRDVGASAFADARVGHLSGGEQQRVLVAHALVRRPRLLLMDEPLANLDLRSGQEIVELLGRLAREHGIAVLLSAHDMNPLLPVMDRVVYLAEGRAASGTTEEVVQSDVLSRLYRHHVDVLRLDGRVVVLAGAATVPNNP